MFLSMFDADDAVLVDAETGRKMTAGEIQLLAVQFEAYSGRLAFLLVDPSVDCASNLHALLAARVPVVLLDAAQDQRMWLPLLDRYQPDLVVAPEAVDVPGYTQVRAGIWEASILGPQCDPDLAVLLTTSGSTGSPKFVRLSTQNLRANAEAISYSLGLKQADRAVATLPFYYSFGMSVLTSHAVAGSPVVVTSRSVIEAEFWDVLAEHGVTFLPGVPQTFLMLKRLGFQERRLPELRALIQAGGRLDPQVVEEFAKVMDDRGGEFFVMYGQTEAAPRIACLQPSRVTEKLGSVGLPLMGGSITIRDSAGMPQPAGRSGEVVYRGPNVMMGYAENQVDLAMGDSHGDILETGDLGYLDDEGFLYLTGRSKRIVKIAGLRISLDEIERMANKLGSVVAVEAEEGTVSVLTTCKDEKLRSAVRRELVRAMRIPNRSLRMLETSELPVLPNGKYDYRKAQSWAGEFT